MRIKWKPLDLLGSFHKSFLWSIVLVDLQKALNKFAWLHSIHQNFCWQIANILITVCNDIFCVSILLPILRLPLINKHQNVFFKVVFKFLRLSWQLSTDVSVSFQYKANKNIYMFTSGNLIKNWSTTFAFLCSKVTLPLHTFPLSVSRQFHELYSQLKMNLITFSFCCQCFF